MKDIRLIQWFGVCYFLFILRWQLFCCNGSISCMWRCSAGCVRVVFYTGVISGWRLWYLQVWALEVDICFVLLAEGTIMGSFSVFM